MIHMHQPTSHTEESVGQSVSQSVKSSPCKKGPCMYTIRMSVCVPCPSLSVHSQPSTHPRDKRPTNSALVCILPPPFCRPMSARTTASESLGQ
mmetsp:Transcript_8834/g.25444  ORF Transcript_8834/g.25444 Transcript_8834/m.25444 type:complete len:93 (-) Transcript_8834:1425-1703(-)